AAEAANHSKDKYLAAASHDLLQPLNAARLLVDTLRERGLPAAELQLVERTHLALEGAETLLTDLLEIARLDQSAIRPDLDDYSLDELLAPLASEFEEVARAAGLALRARIPRLAVRTDARLLSRILRNLLSNACRYTERGSVLLGARRRGGKVRLEVWDRLFPRRTARSAGLGVRGSRACRRPGPACADPATGSAHRRAPAVADPAQLAQQRLPLHRARQRAAGGAPAWRQGTPGGVG
ncbi:sensor histidine kinase, partial [Pseudomonas aeruginosa]|uniref:sensor histidine kinase n=1 Tax=Pseudomonas aeruginosa TaxID=287 RepID=UPI001FB65F0B